MNTSKILNLVLAVCLVVLLINKQKTADVKPTENSTEMEQVKKKSLFDETVIGNLKLKNRFIRASVRDNVWNEVISDTVMNTYENLAKGGVGTILTGYSLVDRAEKDMKILPMYDDKFIGRYKELTEMVHRHGANILMQLVYVGSNFTQGGEHRDMMGASAVKDLNTGFIPREMTLDDIEELKKKFAAAAVRAKKAGFDGVEIHASHGYLLHQFATAYYNRRTDQYGGSRENRYRLTIEVYESIREAVGKDFPIWIKVQSQDNFEQGVTNEDCLYLCEQLAQRGIDAIEISGNFWDFKQNTAFFAKAASMIADKVSVPIIVTGGNREYKEMEKMINETKIEYVGMARPLISNPNLINQFHKEFMTE
jgi:2,4-dienoyl-CoA reductase-like NADH-dependent reductase (Old Yellow Enzyme family)